MADFKYLVSVITPDKVGLTSDIARTIVDLKGNISDMRQTIVSGFFSLIFVTNHSENVHEVLRASLEKVLPEGAELSIMENPEAALKATPMELFFLENRSHIPAQKTDLQHILHNISQRIDHAHDQGK